MACPSGVYGVTHKRYGFNRTPHARDSNAWAGPSRGWLHSFAQHGRLIVVLGHHRCGAVSAAVSGASETGDIPGVLKAILPAVEETKGQSGDHIDNAVRANARDIAKRLQSSGPIIAPRMQSGEVKIVAAYYSLDTGQIELLK